MNADTAAPSPIATPRPQPRSTPTLAPTAKKSRLIGVKARPTGHLLTVSDRILNRSRARLSVRMSRRVKRARPRVGGAFSIRLRVRRAPRRVTVRYGTLKRAVRTRRAAAG